MKRFLLKWLGLAAIYSIGVAISLLTSTNVFMPDTGLDSRKIERNIKKLRLSLWFNDLYEDDRHHSSFFINIHVRKYLESSIRVYLLKSSEKEQKKFIQLLEKVAQEREKNKVKKTA
ncbi:hypothetical protein B1B04_05125 [Lysinibacillus sp. KCTC 33748]|uniref:hypothetical protein n=1 Tax=unclassified Lysinibacillus TaxID=2636778 RepID=UPI0009A6F92D|nr:MULTISPECIES: hypothetical protein [unclassified Lysinibacillus]OXS76357.1 hypothetical protein B1B04_05125 [Lysinibacillus sp. KCTC 33748]SKB44576.1 hypothetical protein SAMN06295926_102507 [Lysinibacillus sp. AC-3]